MQLSTTNRSTKFVDKGPFGYSCFINRKDLSESPVVNFGEYDSTNNKVTCFDGRNIDKQTI